MIRLSEYFSSYVLLWYFLYILKIIPFNPIIIFYLILSFVCWMLCYLIYLNISTKKILFFFVFGIFLIKVLPILTLKNEIRSYDILFGLSIFLTYHVTLYYIKGVEPIQHYINFINYYNNLPNNIFKIICSITLI
jgi:hypothetical protein